MDEQKSNSNNISLSSSVPRIILGSMEFGRRLNLEDSTSVTKDFVNRGCNEIDTAYVYQSGKSESFLGEMVDHLQSNNVLIHTKVNPSYLSLGLSPQGIKEQLEISLNRMKIKSVDILYLHMPDWNRPIFETLQAMNDLYQKGKFLRFGLSNYASWQVTEIYYICKKNNFVLPSVYQGLYNAITRDVEKELFPCLRRFNIEFYAYNILAGGLLSGKHKFENLENESISNGRFNNASAKSSVRYQKRFWYLSYFEAICMLKKKLVDVYGANGSVSLVEASMRWIMHHSKLSENDAVIMGASTVDHFVANMNALQMPEKVGILDPIIVQAFDDAYKMCKANEPSYIGDHKTVKYVKSLKEEMQ